MSKLLLPAEWNPQSATMLTWPHQQTEWDGHLDEVEKVFFDIASVVCEFQHLIISCQAYDSLERIADQLSTLQIPPERVGLFCVPSNGSWSRDHGPMTVFDRDSPVLMDFRYNGRGEKFPHEKDDQITSSLYEMGAFEGADLRHVDYILEGGALDSDGAGTILTTAECLLNPNRNPDSDKNKVESVFEDCFGTTRILWLDHGQLAGDDTDCHIDMLARFCSQSTICYSSCADTADTEDDNTPFLRLMENQLKSFLTANGQPYNLVPLPVPKLFSKAEGRRLPASYTSFLIINDAVLVPVYNTPTDQKALQIIGECFPGRVIKPINCLALVEQNSSLHCVTMHLPEGVI